MSCTRHGADSWSSFNLVILCLCRPCLSPAGLQLLDLTVSLPLACLIPGQLTDLCAIDALRVWGSLQPALRHSAAPAFL